MGLFLCLWAFGLCPSSFCCELFLISPLFVSLSFLFPLCLFLFLFSSPPLFRFLSPIISSPRFAFSPLFLLTCPSFLAALLQGTLRFQPAKLQKKVVSANKNAVKTQKKCYLHKKRKNIYPLFSIYTAFRRIFCTFVLYHELEGCYFIYCSYQWKE